MNIQVYRECATVKKSEGTSSTKTANPPTEDKSSGPAATSTNTPDPAPEDKSNGPTGPAATITADPALEDKSNGPSASTSTPTPGPSGYQTTGNFNIR